jgi:hypothetical protein
MRIDEEWEDWDDLDDSGEVRQVRGSDEPEGFLTTRRIIVGLILLAVVAIIFGRFVVHEKPQMSEVPESLIGLWTCGDPERSDHYVEFRTHFIILGKGGPSDLKYRVQGADVEQVGDLRQYSIYYRDLAGTRHVDDLLLDEGGTTIRFTHEPQVFYSKFSQ